MSKPLSQVATHIAAGYAIVFPERPARTRLVGWLNVARKHRGMRAIKSDEALSAIDELIAAGLLGPPIEARAGASDNGPIGQLGTITRFCEIAIEEQLAGEVMNGLHDRNRYGYYQHGQFVGQQLRHELICNQWHDHDVFDLQSSDWLWLIEPRAKPYFKHLPDEHRQQACSVCLHYLVESFQPADVFLDTCKTCAPDFYLLAPVASLGYILAGKFDKARLCFSSLPAALKKSKPVVVPSLAADALIAMLQGDDALAHEKIFACVEAEKSGTRKRKVYPEYILFSLALLSLFRTNTPHGGVLLRSLMTMTKTSQQATRFAWMMTLAENAQHPVTGHESLNVHGRGLDSLLVAIVSQWHKDYLPTHIEYNTQKLQALFRYAEASEYQWVAAEVLTVLECMGQTKGLDTAALKNNASARHQQLGTRSLTDLVETLEEWEVALQRLESLPTGKSTGKSKALPKQTRLVWKVDAYGEGDDFIVTPMQQSCDKSGKWSAGRAVSMKRLHEKTSEMDFLTDQDRKAAAAIDFWNVGWSSSAREYTVSSRSVYQLVGHPYVYNSNGENIDVVELIPRISIETVGEHLIMKLTPEPPGTYNYRMQLNQSGTRIEVTHYSAAQLRIFDAIEHQGLKVPIVAKQRLLDAAAALAADIPVQSDAQDSQSEQHQGDTQPLLLLDHSGDTLTIRIQVEPLQGSEQFFIAAEGGEVVYIKSDQGALQVARDFAREAELMQALLNSSHCLSQVYDGRPIMQINGSEAVLELLDELQQLEVRCIWPRDLPLKVTARADSAQLNLSIKSAKEWFSASGELQYSAEDSVSLTRLLALISNSPESRFIELAKGEFLALSATLQSQLKALHAYGSAQSGRDGEQRLHSLAAMALEPMLDSAEVSADKQWRSWRKKLHKATSLTVKKPVTLQADLRPYQLEGFQWLSRMAELGAGACLADDMGLGKTLQALALLLQRAPDGAALVVAPTSVTGNWLQEAQRFAPTLNAKLYGGSAEERTQILQQLQPFDLLIASYGLLHNDIANLSEVTWHTAVLDEAQAIKNAATQRAKAARQLNANFRLATTGTPIQNNLMDLHSLFTFLIPGFLGSAAKFRNTFALPIERDNDDNARQQLRALTAPFMLRRHKRDVLKDLPARTDITLSVELSGEESALYEALRQKAFDAVVASAEDQSDGGKKLQVLAELTRLRRLCCNPQLIQSDWAGPMAKLKLFASTLEELLANQHKVLVFSQFVDHLKILEAYLKQQGINYQYLDGSTTAKQRTARVSAFQSGQGDVFLISLTAGGTGLNLTAADYVIHMDPWWNPAVEDQASDRAHRIGQKRPVTIYRMVTAGTIEAQIQELHATKRDLADSLLVDNDSAKFDLKNLLTMLQAPMNSL